MLFIGHFSFDEIDASGNPKHGYFSSIVDAGNPDAAIAKFETHIKKMKGEVAAMANVVNVYIEEILKIAKIPDTPIITRLQSSEGEFPPSISHSLPGADDQEVDAYGYAPDVEHQDSADDGDFIEAQPFITFDQ